MDNSKRNGWLLAVGLLAVGCLKKFWQRTTDGLELNQLWTQFRVDTRTSYRLYSRGIDYTCRKGVKDGRH